ncbi:MAG: hypothetical protein ACRELB_19655 [Polyangiaceae bacterium]
MDEPEKRPVSGKSRHGELTIDQLVEIQPGLGRIMPEVSDAWWTAYYAAKGGNFPLARYYVKKVSTLLALCVVTRPKYKKWMDRFEKEALAPCMAAVAARDFTAFERAFGEATDLANVMHVETGHAEIVWRLPAEPPKHLDLGPGRV